jgi:hypothetical protein
MDYGKYSDKYSGRHGRSQQTTKTARRAAKTAAALDDLRRRAVLRAAHAEAKAKAKGDVGTFLDTIKSIFRRMA